MSTATNPSGRPGDDAPARVSKLALVLHYTRGARRPLIVALLAGAVGSGLSLLQPLVVGRMVADTQAGKAIGSLVLVLIAIALAAAVAVGVQQFVLGRLGANIVRQTRTALARRMLTLPIREHDRRAPGELASRLTSDPTLIQSAVSDTLVNALSSLLILVGATVALLLLDPVTFLIAFAVAVISLVLAIVAGRLVRKYRIEMQRDLGDMGAEIQRAASAMRLIRAFNATDRFQRRITDKVDSLFGNALRLNTLFAVVQPISGLLTQIAYGCTILIAGIRLASGMIDLSTFVAFLMFFSMLIAPLGALTNAVYVFEEATAGHARVQEVLQIPPEEDEDRSALPNGIDGAALAGTPRAGAVELRNVTFAYEEGSSPALQNLTLSIPGGKRTAIVGPTGAGKSTVFALLERFYDPDAGSITIDDQDLTTMARSDLRARLGYADQGSTGITGTLRENLLLGPDVSAPDAELLRVLRALSLDQLLDRVEDDLDRTVGEGALELSGGERQRLSLARAFLKRPSILLLDEPTSSLDGHTEHIVHEFLRDEAEGVTVLTIAHRLSTIQAADHVIVLGDGQLLAAGNHEELWEANQAYRNLIGPQFTLR